MSARENSPLTCAQAGPMMAAMLLGELGPRDERAVRTHLHTCAACQRELEAIESTILFLEENNPLVEAPVEQLSEDRMSELMEAAALSEVEFNVEAMDAARVPSPADEREAARAGRRAVTSPATDLRESLTLRAALERWGIPTMATRRIGPAFAGLAATAMLLLALLVSLFAPGGEAVARNESASRYSALKPIRVVEVTIAEPLAAPVADRASEVPQSPDAKFQHASAPQAVADAARLESLTRLSRPAPRPEAMISDTGASELNIGSMGTTESMHGPSDGPNG